MFLRSTTRKKDGKEHRYYSVVESSRPSRGARPHQRTLLYLGEINSEQQSAWIKAIEVFDTQSKCQQTFSLFPSDKTIPANLAAPGLQIRVDRSIRTDPPAPIRRLLAGMRALARLEPRRVLEAQARGLA